MRICNNYINGKWVPAASGRTKDIINPANMEVIAQAASSGIEDADQAIQAAYDSFYKTGEWRRMAVGERARILFKVADLMEASRDELAEMDCTNHGKALREAYGDVDSSIDCFRFYAGILGKPQGSIVETDDGVDHVHSYITYEPVGVCALITPWNYPLNMATWKVAPALAAGNSIILKPASIAPISCCRLFEILEEAGVPKGAANLLLGPGGTVGTRLAESDKVDCLTFTGSTAVGQDIASHAIGNLKKIGLELGGKSPTIIFDDADLEAAVEWTMIGIFSNQGEICSAGSRAIVQKGIYDKFVKRIVERANKITIGDPMKDPEMGAIVSQEQYDKILHYIDLGKKAGATLLCGGEPYTEGECARGLFIKPTIFGDCTPDMEIVRDEIFGPVLTIQTFETEEEAIEKANDTRYGLAGSVWTKDMGRAFRVVNNVRAGTMWVNCNNGAGSNAQPWGGYKMSGIGRDLGIDGLREYQEEKVITFDLDTGAPGWYAE